MAIGTYSTKILGEIFASLPRGTKDLPWSDPSLVMYGRQKTDDPKHTPEDFFESQGFTTVDSIDVNEFEGCSIVHDLNTPISDDLREKYDCVYDGGTSEHVFDVKSLLFNTHNLLKGAGIAIHSVPMNNFINHGFYQFSPNLFFAFYEANGYKLHRLIFTLYAKMNQKGMFGRLLDIGESQIAKFGLSNRIILPEQVSPNHMIGMIFVAQKPEKHTAPEIPMQPTYAPKFASKDYASFKDVIALVGDI